MRGKTIPYLCAWSPKGSMYTFVLKHVIETLDTLEIFDHSTSKQLFFILKGNVIRLGFLFLNYTSDPSHLWSACISVPYGTTVW